MGLRVHQFACLADNYGFLVQDEDTGEAACVDTPDASAVLAALETTGWSLGCILNTHWHPDHTGGNLAVKEATGAEIIGPEEVRRAAPLDRVVGGGDVVTLGNTRFEVLETGGHTLGHISYYAPQPRIAFVGDTLFVLGCGRLFEGDADQMWASLSRLAALPDDVRVYCAHEYTAANARFALTVDASPELAARANEIFAARARGAPTVPTSIGLEKATNPFLRAEALPVGSKASGPAAAFAAMRAAKDSFRG